MLRIETVDSVSDFSALKDRWELLFDCSAHVSISVSFEWLSTWLTAFESTVGRLSVVCIYDKDALVAALPLYIPASGTNVFRFIGTGEDIQSEVCSEYLDMLVCPASQSEVFKLLSVWLGNLKMPLVITHCKPNALLAQLCQQIFSNNTYRLECIQQRYFIPLTTADLQSTKLRKRAHRYFNVFNRLNSEVVVVNDQEQDALKPYQDMVYLHRKRWSVNQQRIIFDDPQFAQFHELLLPELQKQKRLVLVVLYVDKKPVSAFYGFKYRTSLLFYQGGIDPDFSPNISPGTLIHYIVARRAFEWGVREYDFMGSGGQSSYKAGLCENQEKLYRLTVFPSYRQALVADIRKWVGKALRRLQRISKAR